jgi:hypothetical protein
MLCQHQRDIPATQTAAAAQDFTHRGAQGHLLWGWVRTMQGDAGPGVAHLQPGWAALARVELHPGRPSSLILRAEAYGEVGQSAAGLSYLTAALTLVEATEERCWEVEPCRLKGELLRRLSHPDIAQARAWSHQALEAPAASKPNRWSCVLP